MISAIITMLFVGRTISLNVVDYKEMAESIAYCESRGDNFAINSKERHGSSYGKYQFRISTFQEFGKRYNLPATDIFSEKQQDDIALKMLEDGYGAKNWVNCYKAYDRIQRS